MKRILMTSVVIMAAIFVYADSHMVQYQTWYGDNMGATSETTATKRVEYFYDNANKLARRIQTGLMENGTDWLLTNYYLLNYNAQELLEMSCSLQYGIYDQSHYSLKAANDTIDYSYDAEGRLVEEYEHAKKTATRYTYDANGNVEKKEIVKNGTLSQTLTYSDFTKGGAQKMTSTATASYNCYEGQMTYDAEGNKTSELHYDANGVLTYAEYWTYENGALTLYEKKGISGGQEVDSQKTTYEQVDANTTKAKSWTYSNGQWKMKGGSACETTKSDFDGAFSCRLKEVKANVEKSCAELTFSIPESLVGVKAEVEFLLYRDGLLIDTIACSDNIDYHYTDNGLNNGEHEYFIQTILGGQNKNISNIVSASLKRSYPHATGLRATTASKTTEGQYMVTLSWQAPEVTEDMQFVNHNVMKVGKYYSTPMLEESEALTDPNSTTVEINFGIDPVQTLYLQTRYQGGTVSSDTITVDATKILDKVSEYTRMLRAVEIWGDAMGTDGGITKKEVTFYGNDNRVQRVGLYSKELGTDGSLPEHWTINEYTTYVYGESGMLEKQYTRQYGRYDHGEMAFRNAQDTIFYEYNLEGQKIRESNRYGYTEYEYTSDGSLAKAHTVEYGTTNFENTITYSDFAGKDKPRKTVSDGTRSSQQWMLETEYNSNGDKETERKSTYKTSTNSYVPSQVQEFYYDESGELESDTVFTIKIVNDIEQYYYKSYTVYEPEANNPNRVKVVKRVWDSILKKFGSPKTWNVYEYADINASKYAPVLTAEQATDQMNSLKLTVDVPAEQRNAMTAFNIYRNGSEIAHAVSYFDPAHYVTDEYGLNGVWTYVDSNVKNGSYDYFVEMAHMDATMTNVDKMNNISNVIETTFYTELPRPTNLRETSRHTTTTENTEENVTETNVFVNLEWDTPENASAFDLIGYEVMVVGDQIAENYDASDKTVTSYELAMRGIESKSVYVQAVYPLGRASSDTILVEENPTIVDAINQILSGKGGNSRMYNLRGQAVENPGKEIFISKKKKILNVK